MDTGSVSRSGLTVEIPGRGSMQCDLKRHLSPRTVRLVLRALPLEGNAHRMGGDAIYFETRIDSGIERARREFARGDVAFLPANGGICFFRRDSEPGRAMGLIGRVSSSLEPLDRIIPGDTIRLF